MWYDLSLIPGLLQTEDYARAQLQDDDGKIAARMERQEILKREKPPALVALLDERALRHPVGDNAVMHGQMQRLIEVAKRFVVQVIPADCGTYLHLDGPFGWRLLTAERWHTLTLRYEGS